MAMNNIILDSSQITLSFDNLLEQMPCTIGIKNEDSIYVAANQQVAALTGFTQPKQMIGIQDQDLNCPPAELHSTFMMQDKEALLSNRIANLDICKYSDGKLNIFLSVKSKLIDEKNRQFILFTMTELPFKAIAKIITNINFSSQ